jgi:hypothetical protein
VGAAMIARDFAFQNQPTCVVLPQDVQSGNLGSTEILVPQSDRHRAVSLNNSNIPVKFYCRKT